MYTDSINNKSGIKQIEIGKLVTITMFYKNILSNSCFFIDVYDIIIIQIIMVEWDTYRKIKKNTYEIKYTYRSQKESKV